MQPRAAEKLLVNHTCAVAKYLSVAQLAPQAWLSTAAQRPQQHCFGSW